MEVIARTQSWLAELLARPDASKGVTARTLRQAVVLAVVGAHARDAAEHLGLAAPALRGVETPRELADVVAVLGPFSARDELGALSGLAPSEPFRALLAALPVGVAEDELGPLYEALVEVAWGETSPAPGAASARRRRGSHYTPRGLAETVVERALGPLLAARGTVDEVAALRVLDPAVGGGVFLLAAARLLVGALEERGESGPRALEVVVGRCLRGVDKDPLALRVAEASLALFARRPGLRGALAEGALVLGDAVLGPGVSRLAALHVDPSRSFVPDALRETLADLARRAPREPKARETLAAVADRLVAAALTPEPRARAAALSALPEVVSAFLARPDRGSGRARIEALHRAHGRPAHLEVAFADVLVSGGFDAVVGNPPWIAYSGRAAHPLSEPMRDWLSAISPAFHGYRTLHGLFIGRAVEVLAPGGRLGLLVPTSVSDLAGYAPTRRAHDTLALCDEPLGDVGDAFEGVFQPCMVLTSTRLAAPRVAPEALWPLERPDLDGVTRQMLARLAALPRLPAGLFGERGYQSLPSDKGAFGPPGSGPLAIRVGGDVTPFEVRAPSLSCQPERLAGRLRDAASWAEVRIYVRQTARYPLAARADGGAFRNSILAGFEDERWSADALLAYLNASPVRFVHYMVQRDARQGMPQLKIGHLRALPSIEDASSREALSALGARLGARNTGITAEEQDTLDTLVADAFGLTPDERARVAAFRASVKG